MLSKPDAADRPDEEHRPTYQLMLRHLAKFRDGALGLLHVLDGDRVASGDENAVAVAQPQAAPTPAPALSPLDARIERHMGMVDQVLEQIRALNPDHENRAKLPPERSEQIRKKESTLRDIVSSELHYWSATIEHNPLEKFDSTEQAWIRRIIRLSDLLGVDQSHEEHLRFLHDWASNEHH
ncbi:MAG: hypothetical protein P4L85_00255 [Paludisphaera borealis]|uniref:hypothetical protein n=1 Tax=Paludisphaera borealis TaxID=1387353 RepID=UPI00284BD096|nr:hypothetical protein [Paludisphaera borealis]MDR3617756.1 hypothetical protein [Paludisphaera borealis]